MTISKYKAPIHGCASSIKGRTTEYRAWESMKYRCLRPTHKFYRLYGGRGIKICDRWINSFQNFLEDMGHKPTPKHSLDRIDNDKGYFPENCRWATKREQVRNRSDNVWVSLEGKTLMLIDWAKLTGVNFNTIKTRLRRGWSEEKAILQKSRAYRSEK